jgi:hypothetical protein
MRKGCIKKMRAAIGALDLQTKIQQLSSLSLCTHIEAAKKIIKIPITFFFAVC